jgi:hypothetical protein
MKVATSMIFTLQLENYESPFILPKWQSDAMTKLVREQISSLVRNNKQIDEFSSLPFDAGFPQPIPIPIVPLGKYVQNLPPEYLIITNNNFITGEQIPLHNGKNMIQIFQELAD